ncbi:MAG: twin-arginine translocase TatA/TatE family subunit [Fibrobacterota bacterium]
MPGPGELWIILIIVLILFGGSKIPEVMRGLGKGIREFKDAKDGVTPADKKAAEALKEKSDKV